jgi:uncharacterized membrane protein
VTDRGLRLAAGVLAAAGAAIAGYLVYARAADATIACTTGGCEAVQHSDYAELAGVPVAILGLGAYLLLLGLAFRTGELARLVGAVTAVSGALFAGYLLYVQLVVIDAICQWCVASDVVIGLLTVTCVLRLRSG